MKKIVIIEEDEAIRETLGVYSELLGYEPILFADPESCERFHENHKLTDENQNADLLVVEQKMKNMTGLEFIQKQLDKGRVFIEQHKVVLSDSMLRNELMQAKKLGCHALEKPVSYEFFEIWIKGTERKKE